MAGLTREQKLQLIRDHEKKMAHSLALLVMDKPSPPFWMTFVPMFLVFLTQKFRQYELDVINFTNSYLESRDHAMQVVAENPVVDGSWSFLHRLDMPDQAKGIYTRYVGMLAGHYAILLGAGGSEIDDMIRLGYAQKSGFERFCNELNAVESDLNHALLPQINEERDVLLHVVQRMNDGVAHLRRLEAERIFP